MRLYKGWLARIVRWASTEWQDVIIASLGLFAAALAVYLGRLFGTTSDALRWAGLLLQIGGIITVAWGVHSTRELFGLPSLGASLRARFSRFPPRRRQLVFAAGTARFGLLGGEGSARVRARTDATLEERVRVLEQSLASLHQEVTRARRDNAKAVEDLQQTVKQVQEQSQKGDAALTENLQAHATGGVHISVIGMMWLLVGVILATVPDKFAPLFSPPPQISVGVVPSPPP